MTTASNEPLIQNSDEPKFSVFKIICICGACLGYQCASAAVVALVDPLMTSLEMSDVVKFINWSFGPLTGLIVQPVIGYFSDRCRSKMGRRRPFILWGGILTAFGIFALFLLKTYAEKLSKAGQVSLLLLIVAFTYVSINTFQGTSRTILGDIVPKSQQDMAFTISSSIVGLASIITNLIGGVGYFINSSSYQSKTTTITLATCGVVVVLSVTLTMVTAKEKQFSGEVEKTNVFKKLFHAITHMNKPMQRSAIIITASWAAFYSFMIKETVIFSDDVFPSDQSDKGLCFGLFVTALTNALTFLYGIVHTPIVNLLGMKATYFLSHLIMAICFIGVFFTTNQWALLGLFAPMGIANTVFNSVPFSITSSTSKAEDIGTNLGVLNIFVVLGQQITNLLNLLYGYIIDHWKWFNSRVGKNQAYIGLGSIPALIAAFLAFSLIIPTKEDYEKVEKESTSQVSINQDGI